MSKRDARGRFVRAPRIGSLFSGYGGLDMAVRAVVGGELAWWSDIDDGAIRIMSHHHPGVPNLGDITKIDWTAVTPIDVLTLGFPCQDISSAGKQLGIKPGTRSGLWTQAAYGISVLRPKLVVIENVRNLTNARAEHPSHGDVERCSWCLGDDPDQPSLRALGAVLGDLADLGFDAEWIGLPASGVGAAHERWREFIVAYPAGDPWRLGNRDGHTPADAGRLRSVPGRLATPGQATERESLAVPSERGGVGADAALVLLPTPMANEAEKASQVRRDDGGQEYLTHAIHALLPTPAVNDMGEGKSVEQWDAWTAEMKAKHGNGNRHGNSLAIEAQRLADERGTRCGFHPPCDNPVVDEVVFMNPNIPVTPACAEHILEFTTTFQTEDAQRLLPTPTVMDKASSGGGYNGQTNVTLTDAVVRQPARWGRYAAAIARHEAAFGRPAPEPTQPSSKGTPQLSPRFSEWLMGLADGHITDPAIWAGMTDKKGRPASAAAIRNAQLKAAGNGVVPLQAEVAVRELLIRAEAS